MSECIYEKIWIFFILTIRVETEFSYINITKLLSGIFSKITIFESTVNIKFTPSREVGIFPRTRRYKTFLTHRSFVNVVLYHLTMSQKSQLLIWNTKLNNFNKKKFSNRNCTNKTCFFFIFLYFRNIIINYQFYQYLFDNFWYIILLRYHHYDIIINYNIIDIINEWNFSFLKIIINAM